MKQAVKLGAILLFAATAALAGCYRDNEESLYPGSDQPGSSTCDTNNVSYNGAIRPILLKNCALVGCHATYSATGGYTLDTYAGVLSIVHSGRLIGAISHSPGYAEMPRNAPKLDDCQIGLIDSWVSQGARYN